MANPVIINPKLTLAGQAAAFIASSTGVELKITHASFGRGHYDPTGDEVALSDPVGSKILLAGGGRPTPYQLRTVSVWKENVGQVAIGEIAWWAGDVLAFIWSKASGEIASYKTDGVAYVLFSDLKLAQVPAGSINIEINPGESVALAALGEHESFEHAHPQYLLRKSVASDSGPLMGLKHSIGSTANALVLELDAAESVLTTYDQFQRFQFLATSANTTSVTVDIEAIGVTTVKRAGDSGLVDLEPGDIKAGGLYDLNYDGAYFQLGGGVGSGKAFERFSFVAGMAQSDFIAAHVPGSVIVLRNGREIRDFTSAADGSKISTAIPCNLDDNIEVLAFKSFKVADAYTKAEINALLVTASALPVGTMLPFPRSVVPPGFLEVDGSDFSASVYPDLAAYLGGNTLPESRAEFFRGWDHGRGIDVDRSIGTHQSDSVRSRTNIGVSQTNWAESGLQAGLGFLMAGGAVSIPAGAETRPQNLAVMWCIKAWNAPINQGVINIAALAVLAAQATETTQGTAKLSTQAQVNAGVDDKTIVTPKKQRLGFAMLFAVNGFIALPTWLGGFVFQWGRITINQPAINNTASGNWVFPMQFPTACLSTWAFQHALGGSGSSLLERLCGDGEPTINSTTFLISDADATGNYTLRTFAIGS